MCLTLLQLSLIFNRCCGGSLSIINIKQNRIQFWFHVLESHLSEDVSCFSSIFFLLLYIMFSLNCLLSALFLSPE